LLLFVGKITVKDPTHPIAKGVKDEDLSPEMKEVRGSLRLHQDARHAARLHRDIPAM
jgi:hypothetical protein